MHAEQQARVMAWDVLIPKQGGIPDQSNSSSSSTEQP